MMQPSADTIRRILSDYIATESFTGTEAEHSATSFLCSVFGAAPYFSETPDSWGRHLIDDDPCGRAVFWAMIRGEGSQTAVLLHHSDVVGVEDFGALKDLAFAPDALREALFGRCESLSPDVQKDLDDGTFLFGRGSADMKGGAAAQIAIMLRLGEHAATSGLRLDACTATDDLRLGERAATDSMCLGKRTATDGLRLPGNLILLAVPDEENRSAGMRAATELLAQFKRRYQLDYTLMINSEPHQRKDFSRGVFSVGSVGKVMPFYYVRGSLAHISKVFEGLNPIGVLSELVRRTELNLGLSDVCGSEAAPPPTWSYFRDRKDAYDVSMPLSAAGCFSILTLGRETGQIARELREIASGAASEVYDNANESYRRYRALTRDASGAEDDRPEDFPYKILITSFDELLCEARRDGGEAFLREWEKKRALANEALTQPSSADTKTAADLTFELTDFVIGHIRDLSPRIVYGLLPPWYPAVSNVFADSVNVDITQDLAEYSRTHFELPYDTEDFYTGISDLSYAGYGADVGAEPVLKALMPLYGERYKIPFESISEIIMPVVNIGPWGKDFHKLTERVLIEDVCRRTPALILKALQLINICPNAD
ncbi:MAG: RocB protein [Clostridiales Family XIII bacterium]|jgi:arginine utilization protein RocB|nr:RocB protein [Clostridiales Family XIII bacterium]